MINRTLIELCRLSAMILWLAVLLCSCSLADSYDREIIGQDTPNTGVLINSNGERILLIAPEEWNTFRGDDTIVLDVINVSEHPIVFESDFGARLYIRQEAGWVETRNKAVYPDKGDLILEPNSAMDPLRAEVLIVFPDLQGVKDPVALRIYVSGEVYGVSREIGTYIEFMILP